ncbi:uncharacterized protein [Littorina saxatilis]|uniref:uncharacterized protein n=1 Tax=Littorina saxatilis TaxID=31220 RepID=UPI0038B64C13
MAFVLVLCRRRKAWCMSGRSTALEMQIRHEMDEALERVNLEKKVKYGTTQLIYEEDVSLESLQAVQPGLNARTYTVLKGEQLLQPTVLRYLRDDDVFSLDVSLAQRCLLRHMIAALAGRPDALSQTTYTT